MKQFDDSDDEELPKTTIELSTIFETQKTVAESTDELMGLCSGNFDSTQINVDKPDTCQLYETVPTTQSNDLELMGLCSGVFQTQIPDKSEEILDTNNESPDKMTILEKIKNTLDSSDSESEEISKPSKNKQKKIKLGFSGK